MPLSDNSTASIGSRLLPRQYNIEIYQGDTFVIVLRLWQDRARTQPVDLDGFTGYCEFRNKTSNAVVATPTVTVNDSNGTAVDGAVTLKIASTSGIAAGTYKYDFELSDGSNTRTYLAGDVTVTADVSEPS